MTIKRIPYSKLGLENVVEPSADDCQALAEKLAQAKMLKVKEITVDLSLFKSLVVLAGLFPEGVSVPPPEPEKEELDDASTSHEPDSDRDPESEEDDESVED